MNRTVAFLSLALVLAALGCRDRQSLTSPHRLAADFSDGRSAGGNPNFFFLPPLVGQPSFSGMFNPSLAPVVKICQLDVDANQIPLGCNATAPLINPGPVQLDANEQYHVNWHTDAPAVDLTKFYRIQTFSALGSPPLGFADVAPVANGAGLKDVNTGQFIGFVDGRTLPIKFRIELGATCFGQTDCVEQTLSPSTSEQHVVSPGKRAAISFPAGYFSQNTTVTIAQVLAACFGASTPTPPFDAFGCYRFATSPSAGDPLHCTAQPGDPANTTDATTCARVEVCPATLLPADLTYHDLRLLKSDPGVPVKVLKEATATLITNCPGVGLGSRRQRVVDLASARWQGVLDALGRLVMPQSLYGATAMTHVGVGGSTCCLSNIGWGPVALTKVGLELGTSQTIGGAGGAALDTIVNLTGTTLSGVSLQAFVVQGTVSQPAGMTTTFCSEVSGVLGPGTCTSSSLSFAVPGGGVFVPGAATARFELHQGATLLDVFTIPVTLVNPIP